MSQTKSNEITIRVATLEDAEAMKILCDQLGYSVPHSDIHQRLTIIGKDKNTDIMLATIDSGMVIGFIQVYAVNLLAEGSRAEIATLVIDESFRNRGLGKLLVRKAEEWGSKRGLTYVVVRSKIDRERAHKFYKADGYSDFKTQHVFSKELII